MTEGTKLSDSGPKGAFGSGTWLHGCAPLGSVSVGGAGLIGTGISLWDLRPPQYVAMGMGMLASAFAFGLLSIAMWQK